MTEPAHRYPTARVLPRLLAGDGRAAAGAIHQLDYLAYFNEFVSQPDTVLVDSDYDWGQDIKRLAKRLRELGATSVSFGAIGAPDDEFFQIFPGLPPVQHIDPLHPSEGYIAVSPTLWRAYHYELEPDYKHPNMKLWFEQFQPQERVGSLLLYYIPPGISAPGAMMRLL